MHPGPGQPRPRQPRPVRRAHRRAARARRLPQRPHTRPARLRVGGDHRARAGQGVPRVRDDPPRDRRREVPHPEQDRRRTSRSSTRTRRRTVRTPARSTTAPSRSTTASRPRPTQKSLGYSSYAFGDPATTIPRAYLGDPDQDPAPARRLGALPRLPPPRRRHPLAGQPARRPDLQLRRHRPQQDPGRPLRLRPARLPGDRPGRVLRPRDRGRRRRRAAGRRRVPVALPHRRALHLAACGASGASSTRCSPTSPRSRTVRRPRCRSTRAG